MSKDDSDIYHRYADSGTAPSEQMNMGYQGIGRTNMLKHRVGAANASTDVEDQSIAHAIRNRLDVVCRYLSLFLLYIYRNRSK